MSNSFTIGLIVTTVILAIIVLSFMGYSLVIAYRLSRRQVRFPVNHRETTDCYPVLFVSLAVEENRRRRQQPPAYMSYDANRHRLFDVADQRLGPNQPFSSVEPDIKHQHPPEFHQGISLTVSQTVTEVKGEEDPILPPSMPRVHPPFFVST